VFFPANARYTNDMATEQDQMYAKKFLKVFGGRIATGRKDKGLTQAEFATKIGIAPSYIASIETGRRWPHLNIICDIADELGTTPFALVAGIESQIGWGGIRTEVQPKI
jgi:transcriptional regulator with XRE-family HTH domain